MSSSDAKSAPTPQVEAEPENSLTQAFTEAEWAAVKELRTALPLIIEEAFPEDPDARFKVIDMWGVPIDPSRVDDARVSVILLKFAKATEFKIDEAITRLTATIKWRHDFNVAGTRDEVFPKDVFGGLGFVHGKDKDGRPITYNVYGGANNLDAVFSDLQRFLRWRVSLMEDGLRHLDFETVDTLVQIHDYAGVSMTSRTEASKKAASEATRLFQEYYPEVLHVKFFVNVPAFFTWVFWIFKPLVSAKTFAKLKLVGVGPETIGKEMLQYIDVAQLPIAYGGTAPNL